MNRRMAMWMILTGRVFKYVVPASVDPGAPAPRPLAAVALTTYVDTTGARRPNPARTLPVLK